MARASGKPRRSSRTTAGASSQRKDTPASAAISHFSTVSAAISAARSTVNGRMRATTSGERAPTRSGVKRQQSENASERDEVARGEFDHGLCRVMESSRTRSAGFSGRIRAATRRLTVASSTAPDSRHPYGVRTTSCVSTRVKFWASRRMSLSKLPTAMDGQDEPCSVAEYAQRIHAVSGADADESFVLEHSRALRRAEEPVVISACRGP